MKDPVYFCRCSQELSIEGRQLEERLCKRPDKLKPGSMVSCFKANFRKEDVLTSATLFMNLHHTDLPLSLLERIAEAELNRLDSLSVKTTTVKVKNDVALVVNDVKEVDEFTGVYGGLLEIKPVIVKKLSLPDMPAGEIDSIKGEFGNYRISLKMPSVIDFEKCTFCGLCIGVCPEGCIDEYFGVDLSACSYCKKCKDICPHGVIELHRYSEMEIEASQVLIDDHLRINLPDDSRGIHKLSNINDLLSGIGEYQVSELIKHFPSVCQYHRGFDSGCMRCLEVCPSEAIKKNDEGLYIDHFMCEDCGSCVAVCPTGAMQYAGFDDRMFLDYLRAIKPAGYTLVIATEEELRRFHLRDPKRRFQGVLFLEHPNPDALDAALLLALFASGPEGVYIGFKGTESGRVVTFVNDLLKELFGTEQFFKKFRADEKRIEPIKTPLQTPLEIKTAPRHALIASVISSLMKQAGVKTLRLGEGEVRFSEIYCNEQRCSLCLACVNVCNIGAMRAVKEDFSLRFRASDCINCDLCVELCPEKALSAERVQQIEEGFFDEKILARDEPLYCKRCGKLFGNRRVFDEVVRRLTEAGLFQERGKFLHLCEDCRVIAMFEEPVGEE